MDVLKMMNVNGVKKNMENNETTEELTTKELEEGLVRWYETKVMSRLSQTITYIPYWMS